MFSDVFSGYRNGKLALNGLILWQGIGSNVFSHQLQGPEN